MSVLETYVSWMNSVLAENGDRVDGLKAVTEGRVLCQLIDILDPSVRSIRSKVEASDDPVPLNYIRTALEHMKHNGIKIRFHAEDILHNEIKSMLDVLWLLILNYGIHFIGQNANNRSVAEGKRKLLKWCQKQLATTFNFHKTLSANLCDAGWFVRLLEQATHYRVSKQEDMSEYVEDLLTEIQKHYFIEKDIIKGSDVVDGTVEEHALMIYLSLLKRKMKDHGQHRCSQRSILTQSNHETVLSRSRYHSTGRLPSSDNSQTNLTASHSKSLHDLTKNDKKHTITKRQNWPKRDSSSPENLLENEYSYQTSRDQEEKMDFQTISDIKGKISGIRTNVVSQLSKNSHIRDEYLSPLDLPRLNQSLTEGGNKSYYVEAEKLPTQGMSSLNYKVNIDVSPYREINRSRILDGELQEPTDKHGNKTCEKNMNVTVKRPRDYIRQWEDTMDRLSSVSATNEFGMPRSALISKHKIRSKSSDTRVRFNTLASRSKSVNDLNTDHGLTSDTITSDSEVNCRDTDQITTSGETDNSGEKSFELIIGHQSNNDHHAGTGRSKDLTLIDALRLARENVQSTFSSRKLTPHSTEFENSDETSEQTVLKTRISAPSGSGVDIKVDKGLSLDTDLSNGSQLSRFSILPSSRSWDVYCTSHQKLGIDSKQPPQENVSKYDYTSIASTRSRSITPVLNKGNEQNPELYELSTDRFISDSNNDTFIPNSHCFSFKDQEQDILKRLNLSPRRDIMGSCDLIHSPGNAFTERQSFNKITPEKKDEEFNKILAHQNDEKEFRPNINKGSSRVPRKEAWEKEMKRKDFEDSFHTAESQFRFVDRSKELVKDEGSTQRDASLLRRSPNPETSFGQQALYTKKEAVNSQAREPAQKQFNNSYVTTKKVTVTAGARSDGNVLKHHSPTILDLKNNEDLSAAQGHIKYYLGHKDNSIHRLTPEISLKNISSAGGNELNRKEKWRYLISLHDLSEYNFIELKQALASSLVENDLLEAKLNNTQYDINDKLKHTNAVLDDCRHHLAKAQAENMELRTLLGQENQKNEANESRMKDLEINILKMKTDNQELESKLEQTSKMLEYALSETKTGVDALHDENSALILRLANLQNDNDSLLEDVHQLKRDQTKAMNTVDELRECLSLVTQQRQELLDEITSSKRQEQTARVQEIINNYQEKGAQDEQERELQQSSGEFFSSNSSDLHHLNSSYQKTNPRFYDLDEQDRLYMEAAAYYDEQPLREIYPHRKYYVPNRRHYSHNQRNDLPSTSLRRKSLPENESYLNLSQKRQNQSDQDRSRSRQNQSDHDKSRSKQNQSDHDRSRSQVLASHKTSTHSTYNSSASFEGSVFSKIKPTHAAFSHHLNRPASSEDVSQQRSRTPSPMLCSTHSSKTTTDDRFDHSSTAGRSLSNVHNDRTEFSQGRIKSHHHLSLKSASEKNQISKRAHSMPDHLSINKENRTIYSDRKRQQNAYTDGRSVSTTRQKEIDDSMKITNHISKYSLSKTKFGAQNESDGEDTGINSSMSSRSSSEIIPARKQTSPLSNEQRRYADELIQKYTGKYTLDSSVGLLND